MSQNISTELKFNNAQQPRRMKISFTSQLKREITQEVVICLSLEISLTSLKHCTLYEAYSYP